MNNSTAAVTIQKHFRGKQARNFASILKNWNMKKKSRSMWNNDLQQLSNHLYSLPKRLIRGHSSITKSKTFPLIDDQYVIMFSPAGCVSSYSSSFQEFLSYAASNQTLRMLIDSLIISNENYYTSLGVQIYKPGSSVIDQALNYLHSNSKRVNLTGKINLPNKNIVHRAMHGGKVGSLNTELLSHIVTGPGIYFVQTCRPFKCMTNPSSRIRRCVFHERSLKQKSTKPLTKPSTTLRLPSKATYSNRNRLQFRISNYNQLSNEYYKTLHQLYLDQSNKEQLDRVLQNIQRDNYFIRNPNKLLDYILDFYNDYGISTQSYLSNLNNAVRNQEKLKLSHPRLKSVRQMSANLKTITKQNYVDYIGVELLKKILAKQKELLNV